MINEQIIQCAIEEGFSSAAIVDTSEIVFDPGFRPYCEENLCGQIAALLGDLKKKNDHILTHYAGKTQYPGQRVQVDVKFVPAVCHVGEAAGQQFYQYTAIDEYSRYRYVEAFEEHSTHSSTVFLEHMLKAFPFEVKCVQTDNGSEFTKRLLPSGSSSPTLFERTLKQRGIQHKLIRPYTPRHNGKVERSHRKDNENFYASHRFYSFADFASQLQVHNRNYNRFPMRPLGWKSPKEYLHSFFEGSVTHH